VRGKRIYGETSFRFVTKGFGGLKRQQQNGATGRQRWKTEVENQQNTHARTIATNQDKNPESEGPNIFGFTGLRKVWEYGRRTTRKKEVGSTRMDGLHDGNID